MKHPKFTKLKTVALALILTISSSQLFAQTTNGIFFQAVARDNFSNPAKDRKIFVQTSIIQTTITGTKVLTEEHQATTDASGVFSISIGNGTRVSGTASNLASIDWSKGPFFLNLKVAITPIGGTTSWDYTKEWVDMGTTSFGAVPYAYYAANVAGFDTKLNIADSAKYVTPAKLAAKTFDTASISNRINLKANATDVTSSLNTKLNIADSVTKYITPTQLASYNFSSGSGGATIDTTYLSNRINLKANASDLTSGLAIKANATDVSNALSLKADASDVTTALNLKANNTDVTSALNLKANAADLTAGLALKVNASQLGIANGIATLNSFGIIPSSQLPPVTLSSTSVVGSDADMIALSSATVGSIAIRTDLNKNYVLSALPASTLGNWVELLTPAAPVQTVNGYTGSVNIAKSDIGLGYVDNTSDVTKPVSNPTQAALNLKLDANKVGVASGVASLNALGKVPTDQIPAISFSSVKVLNSQADMLALSSAVVGSVVIRTDVNKNYVLAQSNPSVLANWIELLTPAPPVQTVNGYSGNVTIAKSDIGLGNVDNTTDASKPVSVATQSALDLKANSTDMTTALNLKAPLASPTFTGTVTTSAINTGALSSTSVTAPTYASTPKTLTYSGSTINWNPAQGLNAAITLTQNSALSFTSAPPVGSYGTVVLTQDATGGRTITLPSFTGITNKVLGSTSTTTVALSATASAKDILNFYFDGTICYWNIGQGYGAAASAPSVTTNLASSVTGNLAVANGGTGATSLTGLIKGNGTSAMTAAVAGTDYQAPLTLTTTGSSSATLSGTTINIPIGIPYTGATGAVNLGAYNLTVNSLTIGQGGRSSNNNTAIGIGVLPSTTSGSNNTGLGSNALAANTGDNNVGIGFQALKLNTSGGNNIAIGQNAANSNLTGSNNVAIGFQTAFWATSDNITAVGSMALNAEKGAGNTAIGVGAGKVGSGGPYINTTNSTFLGFNTTTGKTTDVTITNATAIGYGATVNASNTIQLGNTSVTNVNTSGALTTGDVTYPKTHGTSGQVLTTTGSGTLSWTTPASGGGSSTHTIGESYGGGIVFYTWDGGAHGLIGANTELNSGQAMAWGGGSGAYVGTPNFYGVLGGKINTQRILNVIPVPTYGSGDPQTGQRCAAYWAAIYMNPAVIVGGVTVTPQFSDWYLPNATELMLFATQSAYFPNCNFATHDHWTSCERTDYAYLAFALGANSNSYIYQDNKSSAKYVVAIRSF